MSRTYSTYEAKTRFSEVLRQVRAGQSVVIAYRGEPVAEIRPIEPAAPGLAARLESMAAAGTLLPRAAGRAPLRPLAKKPGALGRFLAERE